MPQIILALCALIFISCASKNSIEILHINDAHAYLGGMRTDHSSSYDENSSFGGFARLQTELKKHKNALKIDAGDRFQGSLYFALFGYEPLVRIDEIMSFDAMTLGNHEFDKGCEFLNAYINALKSPIIAANIKTTPACELKTQKIKPFVIKEINGAKVGIIGISHDNPKIVSKACDCVSFTDAKTAINEQITALKAQNVGIIILVTHLGLESDIKLAKSLADIDIIIGGHTHSYLGDSKDEKSEGAYPLVLKSPKNEPVLVVQAKFGAEYAGILNISFDKNGVISEFSGEPKRLESAQDEQIKELLKPYNEQIAKMSKIIGYNEIEMNDGLSECRKAECLSALLLSQAMIESAKKYGAQIALNNAGNSRSALPKGAINELDLLEVFPFSDKIVVKELSGAQIKEVLERGVAKKKLTNLSSLIQPANLKYSINSANPPFERIFDIYVKVDNRWQKLEFSRIYKVVTNSYLARGGSGFSVFQSAKTIKELDINDIQALRDFIIKHSPIKQIEKNLINFK